MAGYGRHRLLGDRVRLRGLDRFLIIGASLGVFALWACSSSPQNNQRVNNSTVSSPIDFSQNEIESNANCSSTHMQVYQPPLTLGGSGRVMQVKSTETCEDTPKTGWETGPENYLCLAYSDFLVSLRVSDNEKSAVNSVNFMLSISIKHPRDRAVPSFKDRLREDISIGYVGVEKDYEIIKVNEVSLSEDSQLWAVLTYEIFAKWSDEKAPRENISNLKLPYRVTLSNWQRSRFGSDVPFYPCPRINLIETDDLEVIYD